ncbi:MAG TPA: glycosyltransferase family 4 protein [Methanocella sp.]|jgi:glycosyltransferase involved in cell wall biosynthesis
MHICLVNALFHPFSGGVEKHMYELSRELVRQGVDVTVVTAQIRGTQAYEEIDGVRVHRIPCLEIRAPGLYPPPLIVAPGFVRRLKQLDEQYHFDIIHLQNRFFPDFDMAARYCRQKKKPFMITIHNARPVGISLPVTVGGLTYDWLIGRLPFARADRIIAVSEWVRGDIAKYRIDPGKIVPVHNGIDVREFRSSDARELRGKYGIGDDPMLLFVGRMITQKGLPYLIDAMPQVLKEHPRAKLFLVGRGSALKGLKSKVAARGLEKSVIFSGYLSEQELKEAYGTCDLFVLPSVWEVLPIAVLEAMSSGKPVVCTDAGGDRELVRDGVNGYVVPMRDSGALAEKVNRTLADGDMRRRMGAASRRIAEEEFDWKLIGAQTKRVYEELLKEYYP